MVRIRNSSFVVPKDARVKTCSCHFRLLMNVLNSNEIEQNLVFLCKVIHDHKVDILDEFFITQCTSLSF